MAKDQGAALDRKKLMGDPIMVTTIVVLIAFLTLFILYPLAILLVDSFITESGPSLDVFSRVLAMPSFTKAITNTLAVGFLVHHPACTVKEHSARLVVHGIAQRGDRCRLFRMVIEQQIRPVQTDIIQLPVCLQLFPQRRGQMIQHICAKTAVCVGRGHLSFLLLAVPVPAALFRLH